MNTTQPTVTLHMVSSLDGFIAKPDNDVSWLESPANVYEGGVAEDGDEVEQLLASIDCYVMGSRTYEHALELGWPYGDTPVIVMTSRELPSSRESVEFFSGDPTTLVRDYLPTRFGNIWLVGGALSCQSFLDLGLVDEIRLSIAPVLLGSGLRLFSDDASESRWQLKDVVAYKTGYVEMLYSSEVKSSVTE